MRLPSGRLTMCVGELNKRCRFDVRCRHKMRCDVRPPGGRRAQQAPLTVHSRSAVWIVELLHRYSMPLPLGKDPVRFVKD